MPDYLRTSSGIEIPVVARERAGGGEIGEPGEFPFTRGPYPTMYRGRHWTMRQYAGFGNAGETNARFKGLLDAGQTGLSVAFDLPTQMGLDSDDPRSLGEVGKVGVAIDTIEDMRTLLDGLPIDRISTSMTINATAPLLLLMYQLVAEEQGISGAAVRGTVQNDILKEYVARGTYIFPPRHSMRLVTDLFAYAATELPSWNTISISGYHIREAGSTAAQEVAFTIANGVAYVRAAIEAGLDIDDFSPRLSFFWNCHNHFFEEIAKFRAARRMWAHIMRHELGAQDPRSWAMRFHTQTAGSTLTAQQPHTNVVRTTVQAMAATMGGTQSLHTNSYDEALGLPTEESARLALRTQQILAHESGLADTVDPWAGSWFMEGLTDDVETAARTIFDEIEAIGGAVAAIEDGWMQREIEEAAYRTAKLQDAGDEVVVGVNRFTVDDDPEIPVMRVDPQLETDQVRALERRRQTRDGDAVEFALNALTSQASGSGNLLPPMREALRVGASIGEICGRLRSVFGEYRP